MKRYFFVLFLSACLVLPTVLGYSESITSDSIETLSPKEITALLPEAKKQPVFVEFKTRFCASCQKMAPLIAKELPRHSGIKPYIIDIQQEDDTHDAIITAFKPSIVPVLIFIERGGRIQTIYTDFHDQADIQRAFNCLDTPATCPSGGSLQENKTPSWLDTSYDTINHTVATQAENGSMLILLSAFLAGILTSFFPCTIALLPVLVGYVGGYANGSKKQVVLQVLLFTLGLASIMTVLGIGLSLAGRTFGSQQHPAIFIALGLLCIVMALQMLEWIQLPLPQVIKQLPESRSGQYWSFYVLGLAFGLVASPCGTPVLATLLGLISLKGNPVLGGASLFLYAIGQMVLLVIVGLFTGLLKYRGVLMHVGHVLNKLSAVILCFVGLWFILQAFGLLHP